MTEPIIDQSPPLVVATCTQSACERRAEWTITARDHDGAALTTLLACANTGHRGQQAAAAWQHHETVTVEIRMIRERH